MGNASRTDPAERVNEMLAAEPDPNLEYYALTILLETGSIQYSCQSAWVGFTEETPRREIRRASLVRADRIVRLWREMAQTALVVNTLNDMSLFFAFGGNAVVERSLAEQAVPEWLKPTPVANVGAHGFVELLTLPPGALHRAPTPKHRMRIIQRDGYRCRVCGRSPNNHSDLELHVHHVRPWAVGGVTEDSNLITLCHTCHNGLDPHFEYALFSLLPEASRDERQQAYRNALQGYQKEVFRRTKIEESGSSA